MSSARHTARVDGPNRVRQCAGRVNAIVRNGLGDRLRHSLAQLRAGSEAVTLNGVVAKALSALARWTIDERPHIAVALREIDPSWNTARSGCSVLASDIRSGNGDAIPREVEQIVAVKAVSLKVLEVGDVGRGQGAGEIAPCLGPVAVFGKSHGASYLFSL